MTHQKELIFGTHAVLAAWQNPRRVCHKLYVTEKTLKQFQKLNLKTHKRPKPILKDTKFFKHFFREPVVHQNVLLEAVPLSQPSLKSYLTPAKTQDLILILDQIQDPQNLGAIMRTAVAFGVSAIILQKQNSVGITPNAIKVATGAFEHLPIIIVSNLNQAVQTLKKEGYWIAAFSEAGQTYLQHYKPASKNAIILGAEGPGIREQLLKNSDIILKLPTTQLQPSINVANAAAIAAYEFSKND